MLKQIRKRQESKQKKQNRDTQETEVKGIVCGHCQYVRKESDHNPVWQCPCCQSAYAKVSKKTSSLKEVLKQKKLRGIKRREEQQEQEIKDKENLEQRENVGKYGSMAGAYAFVLGLPVATACRTAAANPLWLAIGAAIGIGSIIYYFWGG